MVNSPHDLAHGLAGIARRLDAIINEVLREEGREGALHQQLEAFQQTFLPTVSPVAFADMYAQTLVYGLFAARVAVPDRLTFTRLDAAHTFASLPPFLREMFSHIAGPDLDGRIAWLVDDCAHLLECTDMAEVLRDFGKATRQQDPVMHFYESFLAAYAPKTRERCGVYYTPEPVVSFIVRSVDYLLQDCFGKSMGLADSETVILDPAMGTATFLYAVVQQVYATLTRMGLADAWSQYVPEQLLPRLFGCELLLAPYTMAHLKLSLLLQQLGYPFGRKERLNISLTNTLQDLSVEEGRQAQKNRQDNPLMVVLGNPPYSYESVNTGAWISSMVRDYYMVDGLPLDERNPKGLQDDYVKFIRFAQWRIHGAGRGILAFINNHGYLDNPTFRGMRESLLHEFDTIYLLNLHGNSKKKERAPDGSPDENVFDIQQGVAIGVFVKWRPAFHDPARATVYYADLWGRREEKYMMLARHDVGSVSWQKLDPVSPWYLFAPQDRAILPEYEQGTSVTAMFPVHRAGIITSRDSLTIQWEQKVLWAIVGRFARMAPEKARTTFALPADTRDWKVALAQADVRQSGPSQEKLASIAYRPFDVRWTYYTGKERGFQSRPRDAVMQHLRGHDNLGLVTVRQVAEGVFTHAFVTETMVECRITLSNKGYGHLFPLYLYPNGHECSLPSECEQHGRRPNLSAVCISDIEQRLGLSFIPDGSGDLERTIGPEDLFHYVYAVLYCPIYRTRYAGFLKLDFPRIPFTHDRAVFKVLVAKGAALVDLHLLRLPGRGGVGGAGGAAILNAPDDYGVMQHGITTAPVENVSYYEAQGRVFVGNDQYFEGIEPATWAMQIGGYQPLYKWLKDRKGRTLSFEDALHYMRMVVALCETRRLMAEIAEAVPGWPMMGEI